MGAEMEEHLGYAPHAQESRKNSNSRNGYSRKTLKGLITVKSKSIRRVIGKVALNQSLYQRTRRELRGWITRS